MQRRHPEEYEIRKLSVHKVQSSSFRGKKATLSLIMLSHALSPELRSDSEKKSQIESLKVEISGLKEQIDRQQQELQTKTAQVGKADRSNHF